MPYTNPWLLATGLVLAVFTTSPTPVTAVNSPATESDLDYSKPHGIQVEKFTLDNGLQVWINYDPANTITITTLIVKVGSRNETIANNGISHLLEHMTFTGTEKWDETQVEKTIEQLGGQWNAWTTQNVTGYYAILPAGHMDTSLEWLSQVVFHATLPETKLTREREVVLQEKGGRYDWAWEPLEKLGLGYNLTDKLTERMFAESSIYLSVIGRDRALDQVDQSALVTYYNQYYQPNNAVLIVAGNIPPERVLAMATTHFGTLTAAPLPPPPTPPQVKNPQHPLTKETPVVVRGFAVSDQTSLLLTAPTVPRGHVDYWALEVAAAVLDQALHEELRLKHGLVYSSSAWDNTYADFGYFSIRTRVKPQNVNQAVSIIHSTLQSLQDGTLDEKAITEAKDSLIGQWALGMDSTQQRAMWIAGWANVLTDQQPLPDYPAQIQAVTMADVQRVAKTYLQSSQMYTGMHRPLVTVTRVVRWLLMGLGGCTLVGLGRFGWRKHRQSLQALPAKVSAAE